MKDDPRLDQTLRDAFKAMSAAKGECPTNDELIQFHLGTLDEPRAAQVNTHLLRCASCDLLIDHMERFDGVVRDEAGVRGAIEAGLFSGNRWRTFFGVYWKPVLSGAIATAILFSIPLLRPRREPPSPVPGPTRTGDLARVIIFSQDRAPSGPTTFQLLGTENAVVLSFFVPMDQAFRYTATIEDRAGNPVIEPVDISSEIKTGRVSIVVNASLIPPGSYSVKVSEVANSSSSTTRAVLPFEVTR